MSIAVHVALLSGKRASVQANLDENVGALKSRAQKALQVGNGKLMDSSGNVLDADAKIKNAKIQKGDSLALHIARVQVCGGTHAFAAVLGDGSVVSWGADDLGVDSSRVQPRLKNVQHVTACGPAFTAKLADGSLMIWGHVRFDEPGGYSALEKLETATLIQGSKAAFAALLADGSVVTWGDPAESDSSAVQDQLKNVRQIRATGSAFAAIVGDGSVVTWGDAHEGGDSSTVQAQLKKAMDRSSPGVSLPMVVTVLLYSIS